MATASGNDQLDGGTLQRRPVLRPGLPGCGARMAETRVEGIGQEAVRCAQLRRRRHAVHVHQRLHDRLRRAPPLGVTRPAARRPRPSPPTPPATPRCPTTRSSTRSSRSPRTTSSALATRLRPFMGQIGTSPSIDHAGLTQRGRLRLVPDRRAARLRADRGGLAGAQDRRPHGRRRRARRRDPHLPGQARRRRRVPGRHARAAGRRRDRRAHLRRFGHGHAPGRGAQGPRDRRARAVPARRGSAVPGPAARRGRSASARARSGAATASSSSRNRCRSR